MSTEPQNTADAIRHQIRAYVLTRLLPGEDAIQLTDSTPLFSSGVIDSLRSLELGMFLEEAFGITLAPHELADPEHLETISSLVALVLGKLEPVNT